MGRNGQEAATPDLWTQVRAAMRERIGQNNCLTWIDPMQLRGIGEGVARFAVPTRFIGDWVSRHFAEDLVQEFVRAGARVTRIEWSVSRPARPLDTAPTSAAPNGPTRAGARPSLQSPGLQSPGLQSPGLQSPGSHAPGTPPPASPTLQPARAHAGAIGPDLPSPELPGSPLDARFTFDSFVVGKPNELAHAAARRVAEAGPVAFNPLFLYGGVGLGKTHLMHAIAWELRQKPGLRVLYVSAEQFMYRFIDALRNKSVMDFKQLFRSVDVLLVDDVQFIAGKDNTQEEFFHTFNALVDQGRQIVISADCAPGEIKDLEDRIISRLQWGLVVDLHPTDYELRLGILQQKMEGYLRDDPSLRVDPQVLEFLAHKITTNVRVLEGALTRLHAFASLVGREITLELAQDCLADILRVSERRVTIEEIQRKVAEHYNIRLADMIGPKRVRTLARPRQVAMYLSKELTSRSLPEIGRRFGGRDHTTIIHGVRKVEQLIGDDPQFAEDLRLLRRLLSS